MKYLQRILGSIAVATTLASLGCNGHSLLLHGFGNDSAYRRHNLDGNAAEERGDFATAEAEYTQMVNLQPQRLDGYLLRAICEEKEGHISQAIRDNTAALGLTRDPMARGDLFYNRAEGFSRQHLWSRAITDFTEAGHEYAHVTGRYELSRVPSRQEDVLRNRGSVYWESHNYPLAIADLSAVITRYHVRPDDYGIRAKCEAALGQNAAARSDFNQALRLDPAYFPGYVGLAHIAEQNHQPGQAVVVYRQGAEANPNNVGIMGNLGWSEYEASDLSAAIVSDRKALRLDPNQAWINANLGLCYAVSGDSAQASAAYASAIDSGTPADRQAALTDIHDALTRQPHSAPLQAAAVQVERWDKSEHLVNKSHGAARPFVTPAPPVASAFDALLAPDSVQNGYAARPPTGYSLQHSRQVYLDGEGQTDTWAGPARADGTFPVLQVVVSSDDGRMASNFTSEQEEQMFLRNIRSNHRAVTASAITPVNIGGRRFVQTSWSGVGQRTGKQYGGSVYISVRPGEYLEISTHDAAPYSDTTLPLLSVAASTFRKL